MIELFLNLLPHAVTSLSGSYKALEMFDKTFSGFILNWLIFSGGILSKNGFHLRTGQKYNYNNYDLKESNTLRDIT